MVAQDCPLGPEITDPLVEEPVEPIVVPTFDPVPLLALDAVPVPPGKVSSSIPGPAALNVVCCDHATAEKHTRIQTRRKVFSPFFFIMVLDFAKAVPDRKLSPLGQRLESIHILEADFTHPFFEWEQCGFFLLLSGIFNLSRDSRGPGRSRKFAWIGLSLRLPLCQSPYEEFQQL